MVIRCKAKTKNGGICNNWPTSNGFCKRHQNKANISQQSKPMVENILVSSFTPRIREIPKLPTCENFVNDLIDKKDEGIFLTFHNNLQEKFELNDSSNFLLSSIFTDFLNQI